MRERKILDVGFYVIREKLNSFRVFRTLFYTMFLTVLIAGCEKAQLGDHSSSDLMKTAGIDQINPADLADSVPVNPIVAVTFKDGTSPQEVSASTLTLKNGSTPISGTVAISGTTMTFTASADLMASKEYTATVKVKHEGAGGSTEKEYSWRFRTGSHHRENSLAVVTVIPANLAKDVPVSTSLTVTFNQEITQMLKSTTSIILKKGLSSVSGDLSFSGNTATFKPSAPLTEGTEYNAKVILGNKVSVDDKSDHDYYWSFTTASQNDVTPPTILTVVPANNSTTMAITGKPSVTFSESMNASTVTTTTFTLKQGTTAVAGSVAYAGITATFSPASGLTANTLYTATITTGVKDGAGNALAANYIWSFTTSALADVTPPTVLTINPASGSTSIALNSIITATFSEAMNASTVSTSTFTLSQGTTTIPGTVSYTGTTATLTPTSALSGILVYTATISTGAKDMAGNALTASRVWSFTTVAPVPAGLSFANDVLPVLNKCNTCHTHSWTTSNVASAFYTNLVSAGYVNSTSYTSSKIYTKLNSGHPGGSTISAANITTILTWMSQGSKNN